MHSQEAAGVACPPAAERHLKPAPGAPSSFRGLATCAPQTGGPPTYRHLADQIAAAARRRVAEMFTVGRQLELVQDLYDSVLGFQKNI